MSGLAMLCWHSGVHPTSIDVASKGSGRSPRHSPQCSERAHQRTHQLAQPRLWLTMMGLMMVPLPRCSGRAHQRTHQLARPRLRSRMMGLMVVVASGSKSHSKVEESSKVRKTSKAWKICKDRRFGGTFTGTPIVRQLDTKNSR